MTPEEIERRYGIRPAKLAKLRRMRDLLSELIDSMERADRPHLSDAIFFSDVRQSPFIYHLFDATEKR